MQIEIPHSDELNIGYLSRLFDNTTNCYKFFWFQAILHKLDHSHNRFTFDELINEMIADAWYMVTEYHLRLGPLGSTDNLEEVVKYIGDNYHMRSSEKRDVIINFLKDTDDKKIKKYKSDLTLNVPYRIQAPFYDEININRDMWYGPKNTLTSEINRQSHLMYYFVAVGGLSSEIEIDPFWSEYLCQHQDILRGWTQLKLIQYLQKRNPAVPGIADKIEPPIARDIERVRKYWKLIIQVDPSLTDIYGDVLLFDQQISVDHFIPWQYVAHDELWNLHPTTKSINSKKSNSLPSWDLYFEPLGELEYRAYELMLEKDVVANEFNKIAKYHINNIDIKNQLYSPGLNRTEFINRLDKVVRPVYESAQTLGFKEWTYDGIKVG